MVASVLIGRREGAEWLPECGAFYPLAKRCRKSDIAERDPALLGGGEANGSRQTLDLPGFFEVRTTAALAAYRKNECLYLKCLEFVVTQLMARCRAECRVTGLRRACQKTLKTIAPSCASAIDAQFVKALLIECQCALGAADFETQVVL